MYGRTHKDVCVAFYVETHHRNVAADGPCWWEHF